jgi:voltage-gated potassium channel
VEKGQTWRQRLYIIIFETSTPAAQRFDNLLLLTILASLVVVMLDSVEHFNSRYAGLFSALEWGFTALFAIEYGLRLYSSPKPMRYAFSFFGLVDLLAVLPAILALLFANAQYLMIVRVIRMIRVFRVLKLRQYLTQANFLLVALRGSKQKIVVFLVSVSTLVTVYGALMYVIEGPSNGFTSIPTSVYRRLRRHHPATPRRPDAGHADHDHRLLDHRRTDRHLHCRTGQRHASGRGDGARLPAMPEEPP